MQACNATRSTPHLQSRTTPHPLRKPAGSLRITSVEQASATILAPAVSRLMLDYPEVRVEIINDYELVDIVEQRYDAGIRLGEQVAKDMIGVRIDPDFRQAVVVSPSYFDRRTKPVTPHDLTAHMESTYVCLQPAFRILLDVLRRQRG
ncbi:LysR substrate-binding domain-containing protein [Pseudomonas arsenicoxydans]|uniref:LysR substrate-binding domain-containing protein n=1 Tax=Pseudomonas arsenicoxydans TaxID=702115 RepID=UPI001F0079B2|nr:LysR substrate-binding domain-containing protein [Pseudomonas arsenicoxydans]